MLKFCRLLRAGATPTHADIDAAFKVLGVAYNPYLPSAALGEQVRKSYRELARLHHPDLSSGDDNRMKVINTAYELIQSSGVLHGGRMGGADPASSSVGGSEGSTAASAQRTRFARKAGSRRHRLPDDFASGDEDGASSFGSPLSSSWAMKSTLDWQALMNSTESLTPEEMNNPANHPFSHSRFFTFDEDVSIYKMVRGGATVPQVARTLGKPATFVEKRLHNAQFKLRVQYVLRNEKRGGQSRDGGAASAARRHGRQTGNSSRSASRHGADHPQGPTPAAPTAANAQERLLRRSPQAEAEWESVQASSAARKPRGHNEGRRGPSSGRRPDARKKEWDVTMPVWQEPQYFDRMTLEEKGAYAGLLRQQEARGGPGGSHPVYGASVLQSSSPRRTPRSEAKIGRSYANYSRLARRHGPSPQTEE